MLPPDINLLLTKHDAHSVRLSSLEQHRAVCEMKFTEFGKSHDQLCRQLIQTDLKFGMSLDEIKKDQRQLMHDLAKREGERGALKWAPSVIQIAVWVTIIVAFFQK